MVPVMSLWAPILLSAVIVFVASSVLHMLLPYHRSDFGKVPAEDELMESLRRIGVSPGNFLVPPPSTWRYSASRVPRRSRAMRSRYGRTRSGSASPGALRSSPTSTASYTVC